MRFILSVQLKNGNLMSVIANVHNIDEAKNWAIAYSSKLIPDTNLHINNQCRLVSSERWSQDKAVSYQHGNKIFIAAFIMNNVNQYVKIEACGIKSAYNNIKLKYGIQENLNMLIYEVNQVTKKRSAINSSIEIIKDSNKVNIVLNKAHNKIKTFPVLGEYAADITLLFGIIKDYCNGSYRDIPIGTIVALVGTLLYFVSPVDFVPDIVPGLGALDDIAVLTWALKQVHDDLQEYSKWLSKEENSVAVG